MDRNTIVKEIGDLASYHLDMYNKLQQAVRLIRGELSSKVIPIDRPKRHLSAEARARISAAQRRRWKKIRRAG